VSVDSDLWSVDSVLLGRITPEKHCRSMVPTQPSFAEQSLSKNGVSLNYHEMHESLSELAELFFFRGSRRGLGRVRRPRVGRRSAPARPA
jgi:hypothetical protein